MKKIAAILLSQFMFSLLNAQGSSQPSTEEISYFSTREGAIRGYDPVAYFKESKAIKGDPKFTCNWAGVDWYFKNQEYLDLFKGSPEKFIPQYGGYCAFGVSENHLSPTDPNAFTIVNNQLFLNYSLKVKELWQKNRDERIQKGNEYWPQLNNEKKSTSKN